MMKEILIGTTGVIAVAAIIAIVKYQMAKKESGEEVESIFVDELNMGEIKKWFSEKLVDENTKGVVFYPTKENTEKWNVKMPENENILIQIIFDSSKNKVVAYREIGFSVLSDKVKDLLDSNGGTIVIEK